MAYWKANTKFKDLGGVYTAVCPVCENHVWFDLIKSRRWWFILFALVPLKFPVSKPEYWLTCTICEHSYSITELAGDEGVDVAKELVDLTEGNHSMNPDEAEEEYVDKVQVLEEMMFGDLDDWNESRYQDLESLEREDEPPDHDPGFR